MPEYFDQGLDDGLRFAQQAVDYGYATTDELSSLAAGWRAWAEDDDAVFVVPHGEIICRR